MERIELSDDLSYTNLVHKILKNPILLKHKADMLEPGVLDLVRPEWASTLRNTPVYKAHKAQQVEFSTGGLNKDRPFTTQTIIGMENHIDMLVAGYFRLDVREHYTSLVVVDCKATSVIGEAICPRGFKDNCKFFFANCGAMCRSCRRRDIDPANGWCVRQTKVFDGETLQVAQRLYVESVFEGEFVALTRLRIQGKVVFGVNSKICGICKDIVFMKENALLDEDNLGPMLTFERETVIRSKPLSDRMLYGFKQQGELEEEDENYRNQSIVDVIPKEDYKYEVLRNRRVM